MSVRVRVTHRVDGGPPHTTRLQFEIPENIDPANVDDFIAAMVEHTAAVHQEEYLAHPNREMVHALLRQVLTGILRGAEEGPGRRLARRALTVLELSDRELLQAFINRRQEGRNSG